MGRPTLKTIHVDSYHMVDINDGSHQIHLWETSPHWNNRQLRDVVIWIRHLIRYSKGDKRKCVVRISFPLIGGRLLTHTVWFPKWIYSGSTQREDHKWQRRTRIESSMEACVRWCIKCHGAWNWGCLDFSRKWPYSFHSKTMLQLHKQYGRIRSMYQIWSDYRLKDQDPKGIWRLGFSHLSSKNIMGN